MHNVEWDVTVWEISIHMKKLKKSNRTGYHHQVSQIPTHTSAQYPAKYMSDSSPISCIHSV
jgi:hypothetical protein